jgi:hypothetical protein
MEDQLRKVDRPKHYELMEAIKHLRGSLKELNVLYDEIVGKRSNPEEAEDKKAMPEIYYLTKVLEDAPGEIFGISDQFSVLVANIRKVLF